MTDPAGSDPAGSDPADVGAAGIDAMDVDAGRPGIDGTGAAGADARGTEPADADAVATGSSGDGPAVDDDAGEGLAPLGGLAEPEPPQHAVDPDRTAGGAVEDSVAFELALEDGAALAPRGAAPAGDRGDGAGDSAPEFRAPDAS